MGTASPSRGFHPDLIAAIHGRDKREIAAELAISGIGAGIVPYHGIRADGTCTCGDPDCTDPGKHPDTRLAPHGVLDATRHPLRAWQYFNLYPNNNIGLALGQDFAAGDWDPRHGADLSDACGFPSRTLSARSGGGGMHRIVRVQRSWGLTGRSIGRGVELRTGNQAIVVENSLHRSGQPYEWVKPDAPIHALPRATARRFRALTPSGIAIVPSFDPTELQEDWIKARWPEVHYVLSRLRRGKHRERVRILLAGEWERAGFPSQSEAEYALTLFVSDITDDQTLWLAVLLTTGLGQRDRTGTRRDDGHGHKLARPSYIASLFARVAEHRARLRATGDPNLAPARSIFATGSPPDSTGNIAPERPVSRGGVLDATKNRRGRPKGGRKRIEAMVKVVKFLASGEVHRDHERYVRVPVGEAAGAMGIARETLRRAINDLITAGVVEGPEPKGYRKGEGWSKDRRLRLCVSIPEARARIDQHYRINPLGDEAHSGGNRQSCPRSETERQEYLT